MDLSQLSETGSLIRERALELGASGVRIAAAAHAPETRDRMQAAFDRGDFSTWPYGREYAEKAADPRHILAGAQSVVCIALAYRTPSPADRARRGRVSSYAWSRDYHRRMQNMLRALAAYIDECAGEPVTAVACDTKPIAERAFAASAGLGWIGKHTNLITPLAGSYVFLGEIVTTLHLVPDEPLRKNCGACTRCMPACPTGALRGDYTIDATRCISDLTQRTDAIPRDLRALVGTWVWGCDLCQEACPPNERVTAQPSVENAAVSYQTSAPDLVRLLQLKSGEFKRVYKETAMGWRGAAVLRRNAAIALGNTLDRSTVPALIAALCGDPHPLVRGHAAWALGRIASPCALQALRERLPLENEASVCEEIAVALKPFPASAR